jgi:hypothetical protein
LLHVVGRAEKLCGRCRSGDDDRHRRIGGGGAQEGVQFKVAWSIYVGWMPWPYADESGILRKWADKYGISIQLVQINDYVESLNQ